MGKHKFLALVMVAVLVLGLTACNKSGDKTTEPTGAVTTDAPATPTTAPTAEPTPEPAKPTAAPVLEEGPASIDFEDGNQDFAVITMPTLNSDNSQLTIVDANGSKALAAVNTFQKKEAYIGIDLSALLGDKIADVATLKFDVGTYGEGDFQPVSGVIWTFTGEEAATKSTAGEWSVYLPKMNPKTVTAAISTPFTAGQANYIVIGKNDDVAGNQGFCIDNIKFLDKDGNLIAADTTAKVAANSPLNATEETDFVYGYNWELNREYQGDWTIGALIPASYFANAQGPVSVVLDTLVLNPSDWAGFFATDANWVKPTAETFADITGEGNGVVHFQDDGALIFDDLGATKVAFTITKEAADAYAANGGMGFPGYNVQVLSARVSDTTFQCVNNREYQGDWSTGVGIPAAFFEGATGNIGVTLDVLVINPSDWAGFFATDANWVKPTAETFADITGEGNGVIHFQDDGALIFDDLGATQVSFTITKEAADAYAANGGMFFPGYNAQILSATVSKDTFRSVNNREYQGDWSTGVGIPAAFFANAEGPVSVVLDVLVINPSDWAGFFATDANWVKPTAETFVDITGEGNGTVHFQDDGALIFDDLGATKVAFTITKEAADAYAANGGMFFPGYNAQILSAVVSTSRFECPLNAEYQGDWTVGALIPAAYFADAKAPVNVTLEVLVLNPSDWGGFFATDANWVKPIAETFADLTGDGNGVIHFQDDGAIIFDDLGATTVSFTITAEAAADYAANGGMGFPGYNVQVISAVVNK
ncbi:MAG: hypothetical protein II694_00480 [Lachnospiraceae bacterium]|nr:hypothetical protein [Lachnospiraceae bacterium]